MTEKLAIISDVHGNRQALQAVLADMDAKGIDVVWCGGDLVGYGAAPGAVIDIIRTRGIPTVMGNYDDGVGFGRPTCGCDFASQGDEHDGHLSLEWTKAQLGNDQLKFLRSLPHRMQRTFRGVNVTLTHGSMGAINEYLTQDTGDESALENVTLAGGGVLAVGHTHVPYVRVTPEGMLVNCGSVGRPKHGDPRASYVLLTFGRGKAGAEIQYVTYDHEAAAREVAAAGLPQAFAALLRRGY